MVRPSHNASIEATTPVPCFQNSNVSIRPRYADTGALPYTQTLLTDPCQISILSQCFEGFFGDSSAKRRFETYPIGLWSHIYLSGAQREYPSGFQSNAPPQQMISIGRCRQRPVADECGVDDFEFVRQ